MSLVIKTLLWALTIIEVFRNWSIPQAAIISVALFIGLLAAGWLTQKLERYLVEITFGLFGSILVASLLELTTGHSDQAGYFAVGAIALLFIGFLRMLWPT